MVLRSDNENNEWKFDHPSKFNTIKISQLSKDGIQLLNQEN